MAITLKKNLIVCASLVIGALVSGQTVWASASTDFSSFFKNSRAEQKQAEDAYKKALAGLAFKPEKSQDQKPILLGNSNWAPSPDTFYSGTVIPPLKALAKRQDSVTPKGSAGALANESASDFQGPQPSSVKAGASH